MQRTMSEKDTFLQTFEREYQTTLKVLRAYPSDRADLQPSPKSKNALDLAWMLVLNQGVVIPALDNKLQMGAFPSPPKTWNEVIPALEAAHREAMARLDRTKEEDWNRPIQLPVAPKTMGEMRTGDALWFFLSDTIHHRGQFTVYLRMAGGKLPSVYGPTADEPWTDQPSAH
jgi:uncharacterized damage-inducible protein DinB